MMYRHQLFVLVGAVAHLALSTSNVASWINPRGVVMQDVIVLEGGPIARSPFVNNVFNNVSLPPQPDGFLFNISLCDSFDIEAPSEDISLLLNSMPENVGSTAEVYTGGGMFATNFEFYTFGGLDFGGDRLTGSNTVRRGGLYNPGITGRPWSYEIGPWIPEAKTNPFSQVSFNVALGAWTNSPNQKLAWWFGGLMSPTGGSISYNPSGSDEANTTSNTLIEVDMTTYYAPTFRNISLPNEIQARTEGALVWLPYGSKGILLAFGGVSIPADQDYLDSNSSEKNTFMTEIAVYDIDSGTWAIQKTLGGTPPQLAQFCTVVASAQDNSGHFIYVYGGYDGTYATDQSSDAIWVLSIPAFQWIWITEGDPIHRRQSHICFNPTPNQMISVGGSTQSGEPLMRQDFIDVFDLNQLVWTHKYDASSDILYEVPTNITNQISGSKTKGFGDLPSDLDSTVRSLLSNPYSPTTSYTVRTCAKKRKQQVPIKIIVPASVGGVVIFAAILWYICRRKHSSNADGNTSKRTSILSWLSKTPPSVPKSEVSEATVVGHPTDYFGVKVGEGYAQEMPSNVTSPGLPAYGHGTPRIVAHSPRSESVEVDSRDRHELMDNYAPRESMSIRNHPMYPRSLAGEYIMSARSESVSNPSEQMAAMLQHGYISPYELPQDKSKEHLVQPPNNLALNEGESRRSGAVSKHFYMDAEQTYSPTALSPKILRKPIESERVDQTPDRPVHQRHVSSMSSNLPNLPSPDLEEEHRRSRYLEYLSDTDTDTSSPTQQQSSTGATGATRSAYQESFDRFHSQAWHTR